MMPDREMMIKLANARRVSLEEPTELDLENTILLTLTLQEANLITYALIVCGYSDSELLNIVSDFSKKMAGAIATQKGIDEGA